MATCDYPEVRTPVPPLDPDMCIAVRLYLNPVHSVVNAGKGWSLVFYIELDFFFFFFWGGGGGGGVGGGACMQTFQTTASVYGGV